MQFKVVESALSGVGGQSAGSYLGFLVLVCPSSPRKQLELWARIWGPGNRVQFGAVESALRGNHPILSPSPPLVSSNR